MRICYPAAITVLSFLLTPTLSFSQLNMDLQDSVTYTVGVNDVCGWAAPDGKEYALVGLNTGVAIVDIDSDTLKEVAFVSGVNNLWRDINTFGHYAYVSSEARVGLLIIDLQFLPDSVQTYIWQDSLPSQNGPIPFQKAHSLWVDEYGICYLNGSNLNGGGVVLIDVASNPTDPVFLGYGPPIYAHDCYARDSIMYSAEIYDGNASIYDVHDPQNITLLGQVKTPLEFTHNTWLSDDSKIMYTTDERPGSVVTSYDISDPTNIIELDRYSQASTDGSGNIVHNAYVWNDWVIVAYYANGTIILDGSRPDNLVEVGNFDSFLGANGSFPGVWGSFPFLPSGKILTSDRNSGLYVFIPHYVRACFMEGSVTDSLTGLPIFNAKVSILSDEVVFPENSKPDGSFKMGKAVPGQYNVTITKEGYYRKTIVFDFVNGEVLTPQIELVPLEIFSIGGKIIDTDLEGVPFAKVILTGFNGNYIADADANGNFLIPELYAGTYEIQSGIWGETYEGEIDIDAPKNVTIQVSPGYYDDFDLDLGWIVSGSVTNGAWIRDLPTKQLLFDVWACGSEGDSPNDKGIFAFTTGPSLTRDVTDYEVSGGTTWLTSPPMDLTQAINPKITFDYWLCEFPPNQFVGLSVWISDGMNTILLENLINDTIIGSWQSKTYENLPLSGALDQVRFIVSARDTTPGPSEYILKVHFDKFKLVDASLSNGDPYAPDTYVTVFPNPVTGQMIYILPKDNSVDEITQASLFDLQGRIMSKHIFTAGEQMMDIGHALNEGMYVLQWTTVSGKTGVEKIVVVK